jgi:flagellar hook-length control protein FliK
MVMQAAAPVRPEQAAVPAAWTAGTARAPTSGLGAASPGLLAGPVAANAGPLGEGASLPSMASSPVALAAVPTALAGATPLDAQPATQPLVPTVAASRPAVVDGSASPGRPRSLSAAPAREGNAAANLTANAPIGVEGTARAEGGRPLSSNAGPGNVPEFSASAPAGHETQPDGTAAAPDIAAPSLEVGPIPQQAGPLAVAVTTSDSGAAATTVSPRVPLSLVAPEIVRAVEHGSDALTIELEPADLGRVEVSLTTDGSGRLRADLAAERPETLQMLQRDAKSLEQALAGGGVQLADAGLSFTLRQDHRGGDAEQQPSRTAAARAEAQPAASAAPREAARSAESANRLLDLTV